MADRPERNGRDIWAALSRQDERGREVRELLIRLEGKIEAMAGALADIRDGSGLPRCAERGVRLGQVESRLAELDGTPGESRACVEQRERLGFLEERFAMVCGRLWWFAGIISSALVALVARGVWEAAR
jgi:hypothetical protein